MGTEIIGLGLLFLWLACAVLGGLMMDTNKQRFVYGVMLGGVFGVIGLLIIAFMGYFYGNQ